MIGERLDRQPGNGYHRDNVVFHKVALLLCGNHDYTNLLSILL